jgi:hypothetical protein
METVGYDEHPLSISTNRIPVGTLSLMPLTELFVKNGKVITCRNEKDGLSCN